MKYINKTFFLFIILFALHGNVFAVNNPPAVTTNAASSITSTGATLNGSVTPNQSSATVSFNYGTTTGYGTNVTASPSSLSASTNPTAVTANLSGLSCGTTYHYQVTSTNSKGTTNGSDMPFTTLACPPAVTTNAASSITSTGATLNGSVTPNQSSATVSFNYGTTTSYGTIITASPSPLSASNSSTAVTANLSGLSCGTTYHYQVTSTNTSGTTNGSDMTFSTLTCPFYCTQPSNTPAGVTLTCQCDTFTRGTLNPSTINSPSNWIVSTSDTTGILPSIVNSGYLRLTNNTANNAKAATVPGIFPAKGNYISVEFSHYAYNGSGADGIAVILSDYAVPAVPGAFGGSLGYAQKGLSPISDCTTSGGCPGFTGGWIGVALDEFGNYQNSLEGRIGGGSALIPQSVGMRGSGSGLNGYQYLTGTSTLPTTAQIDNSGSTSPSPGYNYQVIVDARNDPASTSVSVNRDITGSGNYSPLINLPNIYTTATTNGFTQNPVPNNWQISFTGSTGGNNNIHEIGGLRICAQYSAPPSGGTAGSFNAIDSAYGGTPPLAVAVQNYLTGHIYTKLVGIPFTLDVAALLTSQILTTYAAGSAKSVTVKLVDNSDSLSNPLLDCSLSCTSACQNKAAVSGGSQTLTFAIHATDNGQKQSPNFTINSAYQKLVAVISDGTSTACSTDSFSVRPLSITLNASNPTYTSVSSTPILNAGSNFSLTATTAGVGTSPSLYTGVMKINNSLLAPASPATHLGTLAGTFPAATSGTPSSTATGSTFTYSEVGGFTLPVGSVYEGVVSTVDCIGMTTTQCDGVKAGTWTGVDSLSSKGDCIADSFSNTLTSGLYGCNFGLAASQTIGRFVPDHFDTVVTQVSGVPMTCPTGLTCPATYNGFIYSGEAFTTNTSSAGNVAIYARNAAGATTQNYDTTIGLSKQVTLTPWNALGGSIAIANGTLKISSAAPAIVPASQFNSGSAVVGTPATPTFPLTFTFTTPLPTPTTPTDIYLRAIDTDNATSLRSTASLSVEGGVKVVSGRMVINSAYGSEFQSLSLPVAAQFSPDGLSWAVSTTDNVSSFSTSDVVLSNWLVTGGTWAAGSTLLTSASPITFVSGLATLTLSSPGHGNTGSVDINANGTTSNPFTNAYLLSNTARATFGVYGGKQHQHIIYFREN